MSHHLWEHLPGESKINMENNLIHCSSPSQSVNQSVRILPSMDQVQRQHFLAWSLKNTGVKSRLPSRHRLDLGILIWLDMADTDGMRHDNIFSLFGLKMHATKIALNSLLLHNMDSGENYIWPLCTINQSVIGIQVICKRIGNYDCTGSCKQSSVWTK